MMVSSSVFDVPHDERDQARFLSVGNKEVMMKLIDGMLAEIGYSIPKHWLLPKPRQRSKFKLVKDLVISGVTGLSKRTGLDMLQPETRDARRDDSCAGQARAA